MDDERDEGPETVARAHGVWLWLIGAAMTAAAVYCVAPPGGGRPSSMTVFGISAPGSGIVSYPGVRMRAEAERRMAAVDVVR
jgi:hypothetical protein